MLHSYSSLLHAKSLEQLNSSILFDSYFIRIYILNTIGAGSIYLYDLREPLFYHHFAPPALQAIVLESCSNPQNMWQFF